MLLILCGILLIPLGYMFRQPWVIIAGMTAIAYEGYWLYHDWKHRPK